MIPQAALDLIGPHTAAQIAEVLDADGQDPVWATVTADEVIASWTKHMANRALARGFHEGLYEGRKKFYASSPSLDQYEALCAYLDAHNMGPIPFRDEGERLRAQRETFGTMWPGAPDAELDAVLAGHFDAMSKAYLAEIEIALGDGSPVKAEPDLYAPGLDSFNEDAELTP